MKNISYILMGIFSLSLILASCKDSETYAEQLAAEKAQIAEYIKRNEIKVVKTLPKPDQWGVKDYYMTEDGMYIHLVDSGIRANAGDTVETGNLVTPRYNKFTLTLPTDTLVYNWSNQDYPFPANFTLGNTSESCIAFHKAAKILQRNYATAILLVPSKLGFDANELTKATPYGYRFKITYQK